MTFALLSTSADAADVAAAERAARRLALVADRMLQIETRAVRLAEETAWRSRGGAAYRDAAASWCDGLAGAAAEAEALRWDVASHAARLDAEAGWG